jgi:hypothetical protein
MKFLSRLSDSSELVKRFSLFTFAAALAFSSLVFGVIGMTLSFAFLSLPRIEGVLSGVAGFVAGAVLLGAGTVAFAVLAARSGDRGA